MTRSSMLIKVQRVTSAFWVIKILAASLGKTRGDAPSMALDLGYAISTATVVVICAAQIASSKLLRFLY